MKLVCKCGHDKFVSMNIMKTSDPPLVGYKCIKCGQEHWVCQSIRQHEPTEVHLEDIGK